MSLVNTIDLLRHAEEHSYAIGAFNVVSLEFLNGILEAAEEMRSPVILNIAEVHFDYVEIEEIYPAIKYMADKACVPVVLNLDHGMSIETVVRALRCGFSAVMYDASKKPLDQNIEETRLVVKMAHSVGVSVEAELGRVGGAEGGERAAKARREFFTNPDEAERFVRETGIDALAVSVGNVHGFYAGEPELDFGLIAELKKRTNIPLVLHGGSGISDNDFRKAISLGMRKVNFFTEMSKIATDRVREMLASSDHCFIQDLLKEAQATIKEVVMDRMKVFGSAQACALPGNICPTGGTCSSCTICNTNTTQKKPVLQPQPVKEQQISQTELSDIVSRVVSDILKRNG
ncbi:MAG: class II fructose-bisphosphate aldolase [Candidatus Latescibacteria bacterium]|nr:class II fructose-bisphosphate aldolase [Candidatus Latescibacterota bacterium]